MNALTARRWGMTRWGGLALTMVLLAAGCSGAHGPGAAREIVWAVPQLDDEYASNVAELWNSRPDRPKVRIELLPQSADDQRQLMAMELKAGLARFDVLTLDVVWTGEFAARGWLSDLRDIRTKVTEASQKAPLESATWEGRLWAAPLTTAAGLLYYRRDLVASAPTTWKDLMEKSLPEARSKPGGGIPAFVGQGAQYEGLVVNFLEYLWGAGGALSSGDGTRIDLSAGPAVRALQFMKDSNNKNSFYDPKFDTMRELDALTTFNSGNAVFMRNWPFAYGELSPTMKSKVGIAPLPTFDGKGASAAIGGSNLGVSRFSKNSKAAKEFVEFASTDAQVQVGVGNKFSRPPTMASAYRDPAFAAKPEMKALEQILPTAHARPSTPEWSAISDEIQQEVFPAYTGRLDPGKAVTSIRSFLKLAVGTG